MGLERLAVIATAVVLAAGPLMAQPYRAGLASAAKSLSASEGETGGATISVTNRGSAALDSKGDFPCFLSYHILDSGGKVIRFENPRFPLPGSVAPGRGADIAVQVKAPIVSGEYFVEFDLLAEGLTWFKDRGSATLVIPLKVAARDWPGSKIESSVPEFNDLMKIVRITLKHDEVSFKGKTGLVEGFAAGSAYPQIWIRDANTIIPASMYLYPLARLDSWLKEHLARQKPDGSLWDWLDSQGKTDKNTVETDQEASAVQAARQVSRIAGRGWVSAEVDGLRILDRLDRALGFVFENRLDPETGLILGGHTADWGDVESEDPGQEAVYLGPSSHLTSDIYDQGMVHEAAIELASMLEAAGDGKRAESWRSRAEKLRESANRRLWVPEAGYYRVHVHHDRLAHDFQEDDIFAMGGNVQAILSGLAGGPGSDKPGRIIDAALDRRKKLGISTLSGTLLPPYPRGFFKNPVLDEEFEYQNGGQWDWFGGKLILAMFQSGFARQARAGLAEIARKNIANGGLTEWDSRDGTGHGSDFFAGSAGSLARALIEGYFGVMATDLGFQLSPRIGLDRARVDLRVPASGRRIAFDYRADEPARTVRLEYEGDQNQGPDISLLNPWPKSRSLGTSGIPPGWEIRVNGVRVSFRIERIGEDEYIRLDSLATRPKKAVVEARLPSGI